jgi:hypothetical protein
MRERQATLNPKGKPCPPPAGFFSEGVFHGLARFLRAFFSRIFLARTIMEWVMDEGFPQHTIGFMRRKREKEQQNDRGEKPSQS